ncbi:MULTISPECIES: FAD-dependent oxidoreductase [Paenibacillus]|uniref:FAD-dependent oxidoreductase n=1 Tax=Paenibacillus TaxID=44249 RepID=UPI00096C3B5B|nr:MULTISPECIES: FAD-dependent oxidoreductase [Paenibacillus]OMF44195.1 FAD-dependent oxidoreductase [Paenibacillus peoriae]QYK60085.1 FAD dependent oxidoreductase [Paenibacillus sp. S25]
MTQKRLDTDIVVIGGGLGGTSAALAAAKAGMRVIVTEETDWLGGQLTSQAVPPDEHRWIEQFGCTATYREFRNRVRDYYRQNYPLTEEARNNPILNPGNGWVSRLAHEPRVALRVLEDMLAPYLNTGRVHVYYHTVPIAVQTDGDCITSVTVRTSNSADHKCGFRVLHGMFYLDATECGDLLPMAGVEHTSGAESRAATGEPHALECANPFDMQSITHVAAVDYIPQESFIIERPQQYDFWRNYIPSFSRFPILSWFATDADDTSKLKQFTLFPNDQGIVSLWDYRRIVDPSIWSEPLNDGEVTLLNWAQNDYYLGPLIGVTAQEQAKHREGARELTHSLIYWLQTEAPRLDGGFGYPGIRPRGDILGTSDGLAKTAYIRESRRIQAKYMISEFDVSRELRGEEGPKRYIDSVGVGSYHLDLHPTTVSQRTFYIPNYPYEIPLGSLIPVRVRNLLPACKNIGMTQIANGCYRLHPTEWNIGESAGSLAAYCVSNEVYPIEVSRSAEHLGCFQNVLLRQGVELHWPAEVFEPEGVIS